MGRHLTAHERTVYDAVDALLVELGRKVPFAAAADRHRPAITAALEQQMIDSAAALIGEVKANPLLRPGGNVAKSVVSKQDLEPVIVPDLPDLSDDGTLRVIVAAHRDAVDQTSTLITRLSETHQAAIRDIVRLGYTPLAPDGIPLTVDRIAAAIDRPGVAARAVEAR